MVDAEAIKKVVIQAAKATALAMTEGNEGNRMPSHSQSTSQFRTCNMKQVSRGIPLTTSVQLGCKKQVNIAEAL